MPGRASSVLTEPIRVGFNARYLRDNNLRGFNRYTISLLSELRKRRDVHPILFTDQRSPVHPEFVRRIDAEIVTVASASALLWEHVDLPRSLRRHRVALFHAPADAGLPAWKTCPSVLTYHHAHDKSLKYQLERHGLPGRITDYIETESGLHGKYSRWRHDILRRLYLQRANRVITVSEFGKWELVSLLNVPEKKVEVIYEAAESVFASAVDLSRIERIKAKYGVPGKYILFVGGFDRRKNVAGLLKAFAEARRSGIRETLVIVGSGNEDNLRDGLTSLGLQNGRDIFFVGRVQDDELPALYCGATALVTLSWGESFCFPLVEAMNCGTPVVGSSWGAIAEVADGACILVDPQNAMDAAHAIKKVVSDTGLRTQLREAGLKRANFFSWEKTAERTVRLYKDVLNHN
jgi:glycosyltransferase involved in cell wall biosynthesis